MTLTLPHPTTPPPASRRVVMTGDWFGYHPIPADSSTWRHRLGITADLISETDAGACFLVDRHTALRLAVEFSQLWVLDGPVEVRWDGEVLVVDQPTTSGTRRVWPIAPDPAGRYAIDLDWPWYRADPQRCDEVIGR
jgi:hypothetical protein